MSAESSIGLAAGEKRERPAESAESAPTAPAPPPRMKSRPQLSVSTAGSPGNVSGSTPAPAPAASPIATPLSARSASTGSAGGFSLLRRQSSVAAPSPGASTPLATTGTLGASFSSLSAGDGQSTEDRFTQMFEKLLQKDSEVEADRSDVARGIARALLQLTNFQETAKNLIHHLRDAENVALRSKLCCGVIAPEAFVRMPVSELLAPKKRQEADEEALRRLRDRDLAALKESKKLSSTIYQCSRCKKRDVHIEEKQTRSADEPMTQFINCNNCGHNWKLN